MLFLSILQENMKIYMNKIGRQDFFSAIFNNNYGTDACMTQFHTIIYIHVI